MTAAVGGFLIDGINHPTVDQVRAAKAIGVMLYGGTPGDSLGKDFTAGQYAAYKQAGLLTPFMYENRATDATADAPAIEYRDGVNHANALIADLRNKGVADTEPIECTCDEHLTAAQIPRALQYQTGFYNAAKAQWHGAVGGYGFPEFTTAIHDAHVADWLHGCGRQSDQPAFINIWQDNNNTIFVGGSNDDEDWVRTPLPFGGGNVGILAPDDVAAVANAVLFNTKIVGPSGATQYNANDMLYWTNRIINGWDAMVAELTAIKTELDAVQAGQQSGVDPSAAIAKIETFLSSVKVVAGT
jgi:hypothetical protein